MKKYDALGYKLHLVYGCSASPSERGYQTVNDSPEAISFSWTITTTPVNLDGFKPVSLITIDSTKVDPDKLNILKDKLYGTDGGSGTIAPVGPGTDPYLPLPDEVKRLFANG